MINFFKMGGGGGGKCPLYLESLAFVKFSAINLSKGIDGKESGQMQVYIIFLV